MATFCLLHGAWHDSSCWDDVRSHLAALGHGSVAPDLPLHDPRAGYSERVAPALRALEPVVGEVVVVGHSMGSAYASLVAASRGADLVVHLCPSLGAFAVPEGAPAKFRETLPFPASRPDGTTVWDPETAVRAMYASLPEETARALARRLRPMAQPPDEYPPSGHAAIPAVLVYATDDEFFEPDWERFMAREALGVEPIEIPGGHFPLIADPQGLAGLLDRLAAT